MMQKLWQKKLKLTYKNVFDIVQFGSSVMEDEKPNDIDVAVIFKTVSVKDQLNEAQQIKKYLQKFLKIPIHMKPFDLYNFFSEANFARENILFYGRSLISKDYFAKKFGLNPRIEIFYSLSNLKKKDKIRFNYMLNGKKGKYGLLRKYKCKLVKPGLIEIFPEYENVFVSSIQKFISKFEVRKILY